MHRFQDQKKIWAARVLIGTVLFFNLQCALFFLLWPEVYAPLFELAGTPGAAALRGMGILFVMWNIPYLAACADPQGKQTSLIEAAVMQAVGAGGEILLALSLPQEHSILIASVWRFIIFDMVGLLFLLAALRLVRGRHSGTAAA